jgi:hypothetical protein
LLVPAPPRPSAFRINPKNDLRRGSPEAKSGPYLLSGAENAAFRFPALIQRRRKTVWGLSSIAGADRVGHRASLAFASANVRRPLVERCEHRAAAASLQLI